MRFLSILALKLAPDKQIEFLVRPTQLQIGLQCHRIVPLHQRIQQLVNGNRITVPEPLGKIIALHDPCQRVLRSQLDHSSCAETVAPLGVITDFRLFRIENETGLRKIGHGIFLDLFAGQRWPRDIPAAWITDHGSEIADQENNDMSQILQLTHFVQHNRMAQMEIRCRRVQSQLDPKRFSGFFGTCKFLGKFGFDQQLVTTAQRDRHRFPDRIGQRQFFNWR